MASVMYSASLKRVKASCGHEVLVDIPPHGGRPGRKGQANIAKGMANLCNDCKQVATIEAALPTQGYQDYQLRRAMDDPANYSYCPQCGHLIVPYVDGNMALCPKHGTDSVLPSVKGWKGCQL